MAERVTFDRSLYLPEAVEAAVGAYAEHARFEVSATEEATVVVISAVVEHDVQSLMHSFCNHVLHETIARRREAALQEGA
jgi:hypothetical protein